MVWKLFFGVGSGNKNLLKKGIQSVDREEGWKVVHASGGCLGT